MQQITSDMTAYSVRPHIIIRYMALKMKNNWQAHLT